MRNYNRDYKLPEGFDHKDKALADSLEEHNRELRDRLRFCGPRDPEREDILEKLDCNEWLLSHMSC